MIGVKLGEESKIVYLKDKKKQKRNKSIWKFLAYILCVVMIIQTASIKIVAQSTGTVYGFKPLAEEERIYHMNKADKPELENLLANFPKTLEVLVEDEVQAVTLDVTWFCVGEDYTSSDAYYFQFSPQWDETKYPVADHINILKDAPYIAVFLYDSEGTEELSVTPWGNETIIFDFLRNEMGLNVAAACGVLANIYHESSFNPNAVGDNGTSYGICQWHDTRWDAMKMWCENNGYDWTTLEGQLNYLRFELSQNNSNYLWNGKTIYNYISHVADTSEGAYDAGYYWCYYFEVPANREQVAISRGNLAKHTYWAEYGRVFDDVEIGAYYEIPVQWAVENGITNGYGSDNIFNPEGTCTRGQIVTFLWRANGSPEPASLENPFTDVSADEYYYKAVLWAVENGITSGYGSDDIFNPDGECTRGQVATFLWRAEGKPDMSHATNPFTDMAEGAYYYDAVLWAVENGITNGYGSDTIFNPDGICTRGQIVTFLYRAMNEGNI